MNLTVSIIIGIILVLCLLLILIVLMQNSKGGGLSSQFAGANSSQLMGVKRTSDFLEKATWGFSITIMILTLSTGFILNNATPTFEENRSINVERAKQSRGFAPQALPQEEAGGTTDDPFAAPAEDNE